MDAFEKLLAVAAQLDLWAAESEVGGWSTHQARPMRDTAIDLRQFAIRGKAREEQALAEALAPPPREIEFVALDPSQDI